MTFNYRSSLIILSLAAPIIGFLIWNLQYFKVDASAETLLTHDNKLYIKSQIYAQRYNSSEFILIAFKPQSAKQTFSPETLKLIEAISREIKKIPRVEAVNSLVNAPIFIAASDFGPSTQFIDLTWEKRQFSQDVLSKSLKNHPVYEDLLVSEDQESTAMQVIFKDDPKLKALDKKILDIQKKYLDSEPSEKEAEKLSELMKKKEDIREQLGKQRRQEIDKIRNILKKHNKLGKFYLGGGNLLAYQLIKIIKNDLVVFGIAITILVALSLYYLFGSWVWVFFPLFSCGICIVSTLGLLGFLGLKVTVISAHVVSLQIILSLALIIHLIEQYRELETQSKGDDVEERIDTTVKNKAKPCFFAGFTTSIGFGSLIFSGVQPVISFGWMMVISMGVTIAVCLLFFPATLIVCKNWLVKPKVHDYFSTYLKFMARFVTNNKSNILYGTGALSIAGIVGCFFLSAENSFINYFNESTQVYKELSFIDKHFGGTTPLDIIYKIDERPMDILIPAAAIQKLELLTDKLSQEKATGNITSVADFTKVAQVVRGRPLSEYELTAFYSLLDDETKKKFVSSYYSKENNELRVTTRVIDSTKDLDRSQYKERIHAIMKSIGVDKKNYELTNLFVLYQDILARLVKSQFSTLGIVYAAMFLVLLGIFKSAKIALIAIIPNFVTNFIIFGVMGFGGIALDLMTMTIAAVAMGMSMDDTIHFIHRYQQEKPGKDRLKNTNLSVGYALIYSSLVILVGFSSLSFSDFHPSLLFGLLTGLAMILALAADTTILPVLLEKYVGQNDAD